MSQAPAKIARQINEVSGGRRIGLLTDFHVLHLKDGIKRMIL